MEPNNTLVPIRIARLIYGFLNDSLTTTDHQELDDWINLPDNNMETIDLLTYISSGRLQSNSGRSFHLNEKIHTQSLFSRSFLDVVCLK